MIITMLITFKVQILKKSISEHDFLRTFFHPLFCTKCRVPCKPKESDLQMSLKFMVKIKPKLYCLLFVHLYSNLV